MSTTRRMLLAFAICVLAIVARATAQTPTAVGDWVGALAVGPAKIRLVFHITAREAGLAATMDSPDQGAKGIPVTSVALNGSSLKLHVAAAGIVFEGQLSADGARIDGTFTQAGGAFPLVLTRVTDPTQLERRRPQTPMAPYPYREEEVTFENAGPGIKLAGTLTCPEGKGPFPAVVLISGSGPHDRDEVVMGHRPFMVLADHLTRHGIAVLRADDRGIGKSGGTFATATTADFATDTEAAVAYLATRSEIAPSKIGLIGHSEGGVVAPMVAARNSRVAFVVLLAAPGVPGDEIIPAQVAAIVKASGGSPEGAQGAADQRRALLALLRTQSDDAVVAKQARELLGGQASEALVRAQLQQLRSPWFVFFLSYDPGVALRKVRVPVLAINGGKDTQVLPSQNLPAIRRALDQGGNKNVEIVELPGLNHLLQTSKTGAPSEYADIEETFSPSVLELVTRWILRVSAEP